MSIKVKTLSGQAFEIVRERILTARIPPLAPIRQEALAEELGISKIPLREALTRLEQHGLLVSHPNRGFYVPQLSAQEAEEIFSLRLRIEPAAAAEACLVADDVQRNHARMTLQALEDAVATNPVQAALCNRAFHLALVRMMGRQLTSQVLEQLHVLAERYVHKHLEPEGHQGRASREHRQQLEAWLARDADKIERLLSSHISRTVKDLRRQLRMQPVG